jgi:purine-binding chemotaxis protein CheW
METIHATDPYTADADALFLAFRLADQDYGIAVNKVQEIREWTKVTPLPNSPPYIKGMLNLRGAIVPVIDLRMRFGLPPMDYDLFTVIIVVNVGGRMAGVVADSVSDVISAGPDRRRALPEFEGHANRQFIDGLAQNVDRLMILLNVDKLVNPEDLAAPARQVDAVA